MDDATATSDSAGAEGNPSAWRHRGPLVVAAGCGFVIATYLALDQAGVIGPVWEPVFGDGSQRVLHSWVSRLLPVPDAAVGAAVYLVETILGAAGSTDRWRGHRALVTAYGLIAVGLALAAIGLIGLQAFVLRAGCTLCLVSAGISLSIAWPCTAEMRAAWARRGRDRHVDLLSGAGHDATGPGRQA